MIKEILLFWLTYITIRCYYWYRNRIKTFKTFTKNGIKGPKPSLISGNYYQIREDPNETFDQWFEEYGNHFGYFIGDRPFLVINDLDSIQTILIKNCKQFRDRPKLAMNVKPFVSSVLALRGDRWRHVRRVITPFFSHHKIVSKEVTDIITESVGTCIENIERQNDSVVKIEERMQSITLDVVCKSVLNMYGTDVHEDNSQLRSSAKEYMESAANVLVVSALFLPFLRSILAFINNYLTAGRMADSILRHLNQQIETETQNMSSNHNYSEKIKTNNVLKSMLKSFLEKKLEREEVTGNALVLLLAGSDTTAMGLTYGLYCLAKNPEIQERLREEIRSDGNESKYLDMVWNECLRLFPPVTTFVVREAAEDVVVNGIPIEKGTLVQVPVWRIHHDPNIWPNPHKFDPQRFAPEYRDQRHPASFLAFGLGPRSCLGIELAAHEARLTLSMILEKFRIETCELTPQSIQFRCPTDILYPKTPICLRFVPLID